LSGRLAAIISKIGASRPAGESPRYIAQGHSHRHTSSSGEQKNTIIEENEVSHNTVSIDLAPAVVQGSRACFRHQFFRFSVRGGLNICKALENAVRAITMSVTDFLFRCFSRVAVSAQWVALITYCWCFMKRPFTRKCTLGQLKNVLLWLLSYDDDCAACQQSGPDCISQFRSPI